MRVLAALLIVTAAACTSREPAGPDAAPDTARDARADVGPPEAAPPDAPADSGGGALDAAGEVPGAPLCGPAPLPGRDGCGVPPRPGCIRRCGPEVNASCCTRYDRCVDVTPDGCEFVRECTSVSDGPCGIDGTGVCVSQPGSTPIVSYGFAYLAQGPPAGWPCAPDGKTCTVDGRTAVCQAGAWQPRN